MQIFLFCDTFFMYTKVQIKTESCSTAEGGICLCAYTFRNGDLIYTYDLCDGRSRVGALHGTDDMYWWVSKVAFLYYCFNIIYEG